jgi:hypothetical protein
LTDSSTINLTSVSDVFHVQLFIHVPTALKQKSDFFSSEGVLF